MCSYRGIETVNGPSPMGHEYVGIVEEVGREVAASPGWSNVSGDGHLLGGDVVAILVCRAL